MHLWTPERIEDRAMLLGWVEQRLPETAFDRDKSLPVAVVRGSRFAAVVVYGDRRCASIEVTIAADTPRWASRGVLAQLLSYPFTVLRCQRITATVRADNARSARLAEGLGFTREGRMRDYFKDCDALIFGLTRIDYLHGQWCRVLGKEAA